ncbi:hypothetical protein [Tenacibaculum halocynthiae]|uniref:hypothetical protein n=1 Tax=Tenacibaculum halocynthiae TaxID=1254437 RepID=UPI003D650E3B
MKKANILKSLVCLSILILSSSCSNDESTEITDNRNFITNTNTDFFINKNGTVNISVTGSFQDNDNFGIVKSRGFVYGTSSKPEVSSNNTANVSGSNTMTTGYLKNLISNKNYFVRGYFEYNNGTYFYGKEIQISTNVDASSSRSVELKIASTAHLIQQKFITVTLNIDKTVKEIPAEIGVEYSKNVDFSNSNSIKSSNYDGIHNNGIIVIKSYSIVAEPLTPGTKYYFRPFAKYTDGTITNGGNNSVSFTTNN